MKAFRAFTQGMRQGLKAPGLLLTLYLFNLAAALPVALVFRNILKSGFGNSMAIERFIEGFDYAVYQDFLTQAGPAMGAFGSLVFWVLLGYVFVSTLIAGGVLTIVGGESEKFSLGTFFAGCGRYIGRFFRLFLIFAALLSVTMLVVGAILAAIFSAATQNATSEVTLVVWGLIVGSIAVTVLGLLIVALDFAKIATVRLDLRSMLKATGQSLAFIIRRLFSVVVAVILVLVTLAIGTVLYFWAASAIGMDSLWALAVVFVIQQLYVIFRIYLRVALYGSEWALHARLTPSPEQASAAPVSVAPSEA